MHNLLLTIALIPGNVVVGPADFSSSLVSYEIIHDGEVVRGHGVVASDQLAFDRLGEERGTLNLSCANGTRTISNRPLFEGSHMQIIRIGDLVHVQLREIKIQSQDELIVKLPISQCQELSATELTIFDREFVLPADTNGRTISIDMGGGYALRANTRSVEVPSS